MATYICDSMACSGDNCAGVHHDVCKNNKDGYIPIMFDSDIRYVTVLGFQVYQRLEARKALNIPSTDREFSPSKRQRIDIYNWQT